MAEAWRKHPSVQRLARVARLLGPLNARIVFIGGAIAPILQAEPPFLSARVTKDVDGVAATASATDYAALQDALRARGFREAVTERHAHRWISPDDSLLDLVSAGDHLGASGRLWDRVAVETAMDLEIEPGVSIGHASAPAFLALKWAAFSDRGKGDPLASHDLEDILGVIASRAKIVDEVRAAPNGVRDFVREWSTWLREHRDLDDLLASNLAHAANASAAMADTRARVSALAVGG